MTFNLATMLRESALAHPDRACCYFGDEVLTYGELDRRSALVARGMLDAGLRPSQVVAVQLTNIPEFLLAYFGILKAGLVMVPINPMFTAREISHILRDSRARAIVTLSDCVPQVAGAVKGLELEVFVGGGNSAGSGVRDFSDLVGSEPADTAATNADDTAVLFYTSGTTGRPKGAELTHFQLFMNCTTSGALFGVVDDDVGLAVLPFFHIFGLSGVLNVAVRFGTTLSVLPRFDVEAALDAMERHQVTLFAGVPTMFHALLNADLGDRKLAAFRLASSGGSSMPGPILHAFEERFGVVILEGYGMSETASTATMNAPGDRRVLSIGKPIWGVEARVVDVVGQVLPPGGEHVGELQLRGHNITKGYFGDPDATAEALRDGWLRTGDLVYRDDDGFFFVVDRIKDLIIRGGYNVYPREVEEVLYAHPAVSEAAVIGRPDERLGEEVVAVVTARPGAVIDEADVIAFCKARLAAYKHPREVRVVDALPKNATGKLLKRELRTWGVPES